MENKNSSMENKENTLIDDIIQMEEETSTLKIERESINGSTTSSVGDAVSSDLVYEKEEYRSEYDTNIDYNNSKSSDETLCRVKNIYEEKDKIIFKQKELNTMLRAIEKLLDRENKKIFKQSEESKENL